MFASVTGADKNNDYAFTLLAVSLLTSPLRTPITRWQQILVSH